VKEEFVDSGISARGGSLPGPGKLHNGVFGRAAKMERISDHLRGIEEKSRKQQAVINRLG